MLGGNSRGTNASHRDLVAIRRRARIRVNHATSRRLPEPAATRRRTPWRFKSSHPHSRSEQAFDPHCRPVGRSWAERFLGEREYVSEAVRFHGGEATSSHRQKRSGDCIPRSRVPMGRRDCMATETASAAAERLITAHELGELLQLSTSTVLDWFEDGKFDGCAFRLGGKKGGRSRPVSPLGDRGASRNVARFGIRRRRSA